MQKNSCLRVPILGLARSLKPKKKCSFLLFCVAVLLSSCASSGKMVTSSVGYQSIRTTFKQPNMITNKIPDVPDDAEILLVYNITSDGNLVVTISNKTNEIMVIDQTMSFFINNGHSISYYDPTVKSTTNTDLSSTTKGASVNVGAIGNALGVGGRLGNLLNGINVGASGTVGTAIQNMTIITDQPRVSIGPKGSGTMSKTFKIDGIGKNDLKNAAATTGFYTNENSYSRFSVCISYSLDGGSSFKKIVTDFYANSRMVLPVIQKGNVNDALRNLFATKSDALSENLWLLYFDTNVPNAYDSMVRGVLYDYQ